MEQLHNSHVAVFGLGGVGGYAAEGLARSGVGKLTLIDFDEVCITNVNRQIQALQGCVGKSKADLLAEHLRQIDRTIDVASVKAFYNEETSDELLACKPDLVIDAIDNITAKLHLIATCIQRDIPLVTSMGAAAKIDPTQIRTARLNKTKHDRLARVVRRYLRRRHGLSNKEINRAWAIYSEEDVIWPSDEYKSSLCGVECVCPGGTDKPHSCTTRNVVHGTVVYVTSVFGMAAAAKTIELLLKQDTNS